MKKLTVILFTLLILIMASCSKDDITSGNSFVINHAKQTVIVYMSAENTLNDAATSDLNEMIKGSTSLPDSSNLVVFVDSADKTKTPYILRIKDGKKERDPEYNTTEDFYATDPAKMKEILTWIENRYPSDSYSLVLWGHSCGWLLQDSVAWSPTKSLIRKGYGIDNGSNNEYNDDSAKWINIPSLASVLCSLPHKFKYIMADCCAFQCVESAYELRNAADYIIGSPAETPYVGAPYDLILPSLFSDKEDFYKDIADIYYDQNGADNKVPISVIQTSAMDNLANATKKMLPYIMGQTMPDTLVYYFRIPNTINMNIMYDMNDIMLHYAPTTDAYSAWKDTLDHAVIYKKFTKTWMTSGYVYFSDFNLTETKYGGISMFVPQKIYNTYSSITVNSDIKKMAWYYAVGMNKYE